MDLEELKLRAVQQAHQCIGGDGPLKVVVSPYRFNPLGAHVDHQGGAVLARTLDHYTLLVFRPDVHSRTISLHTSLKQVDSATQFLPGEVDAGENWIRYAQASAAALNAHVKTIHGYSGFVSGTLVGAGLSSSASVVLAYLYALSHCNDITLPSAQLIELARQVENEYLGLNNGLLDQMSIVYGQAQALTEMQMNSGEVRQINDPPGVKEIKWVICYSGYDRELISSGYNTRVAECSHAASLLQPQAAKLGEVDRSHIDEDMDRALSRLPDLYARRARHYFTETNRVKAGAAAWAAGQWQRFGALMNESCRSSICDYECGSKPLIDLYEIAGSCSGVYGSRFAGGGYGGCLIMLCDAASAQRVSEEVLDKYRSLYPDRAAATTFIATPENSVRIESL